MKILRERVEWQKPRSAPRGIQHADTLTQEEEENVRRALAQLRRRYGSYEKLAIAMGMKSYTLWQGAKRRRRRPTAGYAIRAARLAGVPVGAILVGAWPKKGACPMCGRL